MISVWLEVFSMYVVFVFDWDWRARLVRVWVHNGVVNNSLTFPSSQHALRSVRYHRSQSWSKWKTVTIFGQRNNYAKFKTNNRNLGKIAAHTCPHDRLTSSKRFCNARIDDLVADNCCCSTVGDWWCWCALDADVDGGCWWDEALPPSFCSSNITCLK